MGADLLLGCLPAARMTDERLRRLHEIVDGLGEDELPGFEDTDAAEGIDLRADLHWHVGVLGSAQQRRDSAVLRPPGASFPLVFTGGMSWGDDPTELLETFAVLGDVPPVLGQLEAWAREDAGSPDC